MNYKNSFFTAFILLTLMGCSSTDRSIEQKEKLSKETKALSEQNQDEFQSPRQYLNRTDLEREFVPIFFRFDSYELTYDAQRKVQEIATSIKMTKLETPILINGHADPVGTKAYNYKLAKSRALEIRKNLVELGVEAKQLKVISYGEDVIEDPDLKDNSQLRRVELSFKEPVLRTNTQKLSFEEK